MARALRPTADLDEALFRLALTSEARRLLSVYGDFSIGGARDIRAQVDLASRAGVLEGPDLLDVKNTLIAAREVNRTLDRQSEPLENLKAIAARLTPPPGLVDAISRSISERGEVLDSASEKLASIRSELKVAHEPPARQTGAHDQRRQQRPACCRSRSSPNATDATSSRCERVQRPHPLHHPRPVLFGRDAVCGTAGGRGPEQPVSRAAAGRARRRAPHPGRAVAARLAARRARSYAILEAMAEI